MMRRWLVVAAVLAAALVAGSAGAQYANMTAGNATLTTGATKTLYPCFKNGGSGLTGASITAANKCGRASTGFIYSSAADLRVKVFSAIGAVDTSGFTIPAGGTFTTLPGCDSVIVLSTGASSTTVTWAFYK